MRTNQDSDYVEATLNSDVSQADSDEKLDCDLNSTRISSHWGVGFRLAVLPSSVDALCTKNDVLSPRNDRDIPVLV